MWSIKRSRETIYNALLTLLIVSMWAFNETKMLTYPIKIVYIAIFGCYAIKHKRTGAKYQIWCLVMIVISAVTVMYTPREANPAYELINMLQVFLIGFVTYAYLDDNRKIEKLLKAFILGGLLLTLRLIIVTPLSVWISWQRLGEAIGSNSNDVGNKAALSAIIALCLAKNYTGKRRVSYFSVFGVLSAIVLFSGSRKALIAVAAAFIMLYTIGLQDKRKIFASILVIVILIWGGYSLIMTNSVLYGTIGRRIETMIEVFFYGGSEAHSIDLRERYIKVALELIRQHPITGIGLGAFSTVSGIGVYSHCDYTEVACSYGIIGAFVYYLPLIFLTGCFLKKKKKNDKEYMILILQLVLFITYITMVMYTSAYVQVIIALFAAYYKLPDKEAHSGYWSERMLVRKQS